MALLIRKGKLLYGNRLDATVEALRARIETRSTEFKESQSFELLRSKIIKTAIALANLRDGGRIIVGGQQRDGGFLQLEGVSLADEMTYEPDRVIEAINRFAKPPIDVSVQVVEFEAMRFVAIECGPFTRTPVLCKKNSSDSDSVRLRDGDIYVRSNDRVATTRIVDATLLAELIEIAAEKRAAEIIATAQRVGLKMPMTAAEGFNRERADFEAFDD